MRTWKNYLCMLAALVVTLGFTSCESDEDIGFDLSGLYGVPVILGVNLWTAISHSHPALAPTTV